jgi:hypothetical protein
MQYSEFANHYSREPNMNLLPSVPDGLAEINMARQWSTRIGADIHDILTGADGASTSLHQTFMEYVPYIRDVLLPSMPRLRAHPDYWGHASEMNFHFGNVAGVGMLSQLAGGSEPDRRQYIRVFQTALALQGARTYSTREELKNTLGLDVYYSKDRAGERRRLMREHGCSSDEALGMMITNGWPEQDIMEARRSAIDGTATELDAMICTLDAIRPWPDLTAFFAPLQFECQRRSSNVDVIIANTATHEVTGLQVKTALGEKSMHGYDPELMFFVDGNTDLGDSFQERTSDTSTRLVRVNRSGLIACHYLAETMNKSAGLLQITHILGRNVVSHVLRTVHEAKVASKDIRSMRHDAAMRIRENVVTRLDLSDPPKHEGTTGRKKRRR